MSSLYQRLLLIVALVSLLGAPHRVQAQQTSLSSASTVSEPISGPIRCADVVKVTVADTDDFGGEFKVDGDGVLNYPSVGPVKVSGLSTADAAALLGRRLVEARLLKRADVTLSIIGRRPREVVVNGAVNTQGRQTIPDGALLSEVIETAGLQQNADLNRVTITRAGQPLKVDYKRYRDGLANTPDVNPPLEDGDRIYIFSSSPAEGSVRILGEVKDATKPLIPITAGTTVGQVLQQVGGLTDYADRNGISVVRGGQHIPISYDDILRNTPGRDLPLQDKDEIDVPRLERPRQYTVTGAVRNPNSYNLTARTTLLQAIAQAGGPQDGARQNAVVLRRKAPDGTMTSKTVNLDTSEGAGIEVMDGDYIAVPYPKQRRDPSSLVGLLSGLALLFRL